MPTRPDTLVMPPSPTRPLRLVLPTLIVFALVGIGAIRVAPAQAQTAPSTPPITSPLIGQVVSPFDVHMEAGPFSDPDPGDTHSCSDWEIWSTSPTLERVWFTSCIGGVEKVHTHLGDGTFENSLAGRTSLLFNSSYKVRVRFKDNTGLWSDYAERPFVTGSESQIFPLILNDIITGAAWTNDTGGSIILPAGATPPKVRVESPAGDLLIEFVGNDGVTNTINNPAGLPNDVDVRVRVDAGTTGVGLPSSKIAFTDNLGNLHTIYLPAVGLTPGNQAYFWIASDGSSYVGNGGQTTPDFTTVARRSPVPWTVFQPGYEVEILATGFQLPVNIAFVPSPGPNPTDPLYYVTELYGKIKVVLRNGTVGDYATGLLNFNPTGAFPGSGEQGVSGIAVDPVTGDLFVGMMYDSAPPDGAHYPKIVRFHSNDGGHTAATQTIVLNMVGEIQGQSHFISNTSIGPDGKLYQHMGDGFDSSTSLNLDSFRGKILRMNLDGTACTDNPFYNAGNGINARDYVYAYGFRNPFGGSWRALDGRHYEVENGLSTNDRLAKVLPGVSYGWNGDDATMTTNAIYNWFFTVAPVNCAWIQTATFGGSLFPPTKYDHLFVTESGPTYAPGPSDKKSIVEFVLDGAGALVSGPNKMIEYNGTGQATCVGLAAGPDGLYFTDLYKDQGAGSPIDPGANVLRLRYRGVANFTGSPQSGAAPLAVNFVDASSVPGASAWFWDFGDGGTSTAQSPSHTYLTNGTFDVKLTVTGSNGSVYGEKTAFVTIGPYATGLGGQYYDDLTLTHLKLTRDDPTVDFLWGTGSPDPSLPIDNFSVRWSGEVLPQFSETYTFTTATDDGVRLWVNNQLLVDQWIDQSTTEWSGNIALTAGAWVPIRMEYYEKGGAATARLFWESPSVSKAPIPTNRLRNQLAATGVEPTPAPVLGISRATLYRTTGNPVRSASTIGFAVPRTAPATLRLYSVQGRLVRTLYQGVSVGQRRYDIPLQTRDLGSGVYFAVLESSGTRATTKFVVLR